MAIALLAGFLCYSSFAPLNFWPLGLVCVATLFHLLISTTWRQAMLISFAFGSAFFFGGFSWTFAAIHQYLNLSLPLAAALTLVCCCLMGFLFALPWLFTAVTGEGKLSRLISMPVIWFLAEWLRSWVMEGLPWIYLGYANLETPLAGWIPVFGVFGAGFWFSVSAALAAGLIYFQSRTLLLMLITSLLSGWGGGLLLSSVNWTRSLNITMPLTLIQPGPPGELRWSTEVFDRLAARIETQSHQHWKEGLLVWPESAIAFRGDKLDRYLTEIDQRAKAAGTIFISGVLRYPKSDRGQKTGNDYHNSIIALGLGQGEYQKQRRIPIGEYLPFNRQLRSFLPFLHLPASVVLKGSEDQRPLQFTYEGSKLALAPSVCYEVAYGDIVGKLAADAHILVNLANDSWFDHSIGPLQHLQVAQSRALESQKPMIRATTTGVTATISYRGEILNQLDQHEPGVLQTTIKPREGQTPYNRWGDWPLLILSAIWLWTALAAKFWYPTRKRAVVAHSQ